MSGGEEPIKVSMWMRGGRRLEHWERESLTGDSSFGGKCSIFAFLELKYFLIVRSTNQRR